MAKKWYQQSSPPGVRPHLQLPISSLTSGGSLKYCSHHQIKQKLLQPSLWKQTSAFRLPQRVWAERCPQWHSTCALGWRCSWVMLLSWGSSYVPGGSPVKASWMLKQGTGVCSAVGLLGYFISKFENLLEMDWWGFLSFCFLLKLYLEYNHSGCCKQGCSLCTFWLLSQTFRIAALCRMRLPLGSVVAPRNVWALCS